MQLAATHYQVKLRVAREREREMEDLVEEEKEEEVLGSSSTMEKVAAAKKFIENHYRAQMKNIQERKERYVMEGTFSSVFIVIL